MILTNEMKILTEAYIKQGRSIRSIAKELNVSKTTLHNEVKRNGGKFLYKAEDSIRNKWDKKYVRGFALTFEERSKIECLKTTDLSLSAIAKQIGRSKNAVVTEVRVNGGRVNYNAKKAHENAINRQVESINKKRKTVHIRQETKIEERLSNVEMQLEILVDEIMRLRNEKNK